MKLLLDMHLLLWAAGLPDALPIRARKLLQDAANEPFFSAASLWEITIKHGLGRQDFQVDVHVFRRSLLDNGYTELPITSEHAVFIQNLPLIHRDLFDRILVAQATVEGITLYTADCLVAKYPGPIHFLS